MAGHALQVRQGPHGLHVEPDRPAVEHRDPHDRARIAAEDGTAAPVAQAAALQGPTPEERARLPKAGPRLAQVLLAILAQLAG